MTSAVPLGSPIKKRYRSYKDYFISKKYLFMRWFNLQDEQFNIRGKCYQLLFLGFDILFTGIVIWYAIHGTYDFIRYGLISSLGLYYLEKTTAIIGYNLRTRKKEN